MRENRGKSVKRKERGSTRDIAGRRLRTKNQSSANRANAGYRQPSPYSNRAKKNPERAAQPRGRVFSRSPRESRTQAWRGDVSGHSLKRIKPTGSDAARNNVFPQKGPYVRYARKKLDEKPPVYTRTLRGTRFAKQRPRAEERAWTGGADKGPLKNQSATGSVRNTYSQRGPYVAYYRKRLNRKERPVSNKAEISQVKRLSNIPNTGGSQPRTYSASASRPYIQRGRKNVYWGKVQKKERGVTTDITGGPLRSRNYRSTVAGLVGRDTLKFFGRKPIGDRSGRVGGGAATATGRGQRSWKGDISGWKLRGPRKSEIVLLQPGRIFRRRPRKDDRAQLNSAPTLVIEEDLSGGVTKGKRPQAKGGGRVAALWNNKNNPIPVNGPGLGSIVASKFSGHDRWGSGFSIQGHGYSGNIKRNSIGGFSRNGAGYSGNMKKSQGRGFSQQGADYSGRIKRSDVSGFDKAGAGYSGNLKRSSLRGFSEQGIGYSGSTNRNRTRGFSAQGANYSGTMKRGDVRGFSQASAGYAGRIKRGALTGFSSEGANFSGNLKSRRPEKGGGSISGVLWNNRNVSVTQSSLTPIAAQAGRFSGNIVRYGPIKQFEENGVGYSGNIRRGSQVTGYQNDWAGHSGRIKLMKPEKGGGSVSGVLWNNGNNPLAKNFPTNDQGHGFAGRTKLKKPEKGGGSVSGILWNNNNTAVPRNPPENATSTNYSGKIVLSGFRKNRIQNPNAFKESLQKHVPGETTSRVSGLQVKVREADYKKKNNAVKFALMGIAPSRSSVKASEYARNMKQNWNYKHSPNGSLNALKVIAPGKAVARLRDFQGNTKMHKYSGSRLHPDAKFAHGEENNVKEERSFLTNVKLLWSRMFRKSETQPENLKEKRKKLQYDKREKGLWSY